MVIFFSIFFLIYGAINYYILIRGWQALDGFPHLRIFYLTAFLFCSLSYLAAKFFTKIFSPLIYDFLLWIGSFWFAFMIYFLLAVIFIDAARMFLIAFHLLPEITSGKFPIVKQTSAIIVLLSVAITVLIGYLNTTDIKVKTLSLNLPKVNGKLSELNAVMVSDIHLSPMDDEKFLSHVVKKINELKPDIVLIAGDLFDDKAEILNQRGIGKSLNNFSAKYGTYAITGNHEYINGIKSAVAFIESHGIKLLRDSSVLIDNSFYLVGRDDRSASQFSGAKRKSLKEIMANLDTNYPIILLDHTPFGLDEAEQNNIALQLSGHTHHGQFFPANLITKMIYDVSWGYLKKNKTQYYVSCGAGTWGPRVRIGSDSEIVNLKISFSDKKTID